MNVIKTAIAVASLSLAFATSAARLRVGLDEREGIVQLYAGLDFSAVQGSMTFRLPAEADVCYTLTAFNDRTLSASWDGFGLLRSFWVVFYRDNRCSGSFIGWPVEGATGNDFKFWGMGNAMSSFVVRSKYPVAEVTYRHVTLGNDPATCQFPLPVRLLETEADFDNTTDATGPP